MNLAELMDERPVIVRPSARLGQVGEQMLRARVGCAVVVDTDGRVAGILSQSDFRRAADAGTSFGRARVAMWMHRSPPAWPGDRELGPRDCETLRLVTSHVVVLEGRAVVGVVPVQRLGEPRPLRPSRPQSCPEPVGERGVRGE